MEVKTIPAPLTEFQKSEIERMYALKIANKSIAIILGCTPAQVYNYLYKGKQPRKLRTKSWCLKDAKEIEYLYVEKCMSSIQIARKLCVDDTKLRSFMRSLGKPLSELRKLRR